MTMIIRDTQNHFVIANTWQQNLFQSPLRFHSRFPKVLYSNFLSTFFHLGTGGDYIL